MNERKISAFMASPHDVHIDPKGRSLVKKGRPKETYRAARRNAAKVARRKAPQ